MYVPKQVMGEKGRWTRNKSSTDSSKDFVHESYNFEWIIGHGVCIALFDRSIGKIWNIHKRIPAIW